MIRYPAFDPPEYLDWKADPDVVGEFARSIEENASRRAIIQSLEPSQLLALYEGLIRNRLHDIALKRWVKQGVISKAWLCTRGGGTKNGGVSSLQTPPPTAGGSTTLFCP